MAIRLLATDLDGTFLGHDGTVSEGNRRALHAAREAGLEVMFVTGRPPRWLPSVIEQTDFTGYIVSANGGIIVDAGRREIVRTFPMRTVDARLAVDRMLAAIPGLEFGVERSEVGMRLAAATAMDVTAGVEWSPNSEFVMTPGYQPRGAVAGSVPTGDIHDLVAGDRTVKMVARPPEGDGRTADELLSVLEHAIEGVIQATHSNIYDVLIEFSAAGVTKGSTLALLATELGYAPDEVAAVGDMPNDEPMLAWAGNPFIVANAHASLLRRFDTIIGRNDEDAVGRLLLELAGAL